MTDLHRLIYDLILWLYQSYCPNPGDPTNLAHLSAVLALREFAGAVWQDARTGLAQWWCIIVDDLMDYVDPTNLRGDH